jgi:hypothetical protein
MVGIKIYPAGLHIKLLHKVLLCTHNKECITIMQKEIVTEVEKNEGKTDIQRITVEKE